MKSLTSSKMPTRQQAIQKQYLGVGELLIGWFNLAVTFQALILAPRGHSSSTFALYLATAIFSGLTMLALIRRSPSSASLLQLLLAIHLSLSSWLWPWPYGYPWGDHEGRYLLLRFLLILAAVFFAVSARFLRWIDTSQTVERRR